MKPSTGTVTTLWLLRTELLRSTDDEELSCSWLPACPGFLYINECVQSSGTVPLQRKPEFLLFNVKVKSGCHFEAVFPVLLTQQLSITSSLGKLQQGLLPLHTCFARWKGTTCGHSEYLKSSADKKCQQKKPRDQALLELSDLDSR